MVNIAYNSLMDRRLIYNALIFLTCIVTGLILAYRLIKNPEGRRILLQNPEPAAFTSKPKINVEDVDFDDE